MNKALILSIYNSALPHISVDAYMHKDLFNGIGT